MNKYLVASIDPDNPESGFWRHNDGSMIIQREDKYGEREVVLHVPMTIRPKRGEGWKTSDPAQEAFAATVARLLNEAEAAAAEPLAGWFTPSRHQSENTP